MTAALSPTLEVRRAAWFREKGHLMSTATSATSATSDSPPVCPVGYKLLGLDDTLYGPVDLPQLIEWAKDERIQPDSWLLCLTNRKWLTAAEVPELRPHLPGLKVAVAAIPPELHPENLRKIRAFAELSVDQLVRVASFADVQQFPSQTTLMRAGGPGDSVFFVLRGRIRLKLTVKGRELPIGEVDAGGVFGQISLFDSGPRVADAVAETDVTLARITVFNLRRLIRAAPDLAVPIILGLGKTLAMRIRTDDKHLCELAAMQSAMT